MCGLAGFLSVSGELALSEWESTLRKMGDAIRHRGPDDSGVWLDSDAAIGMVHRRLSILDLSPAGHQPMLANSGRYALVFNGEIYNHLEIRDELGRQLGENISLNWRGHSDTETLLAGFDSWGITETLKKSAGMFAIAVWDRQKRELTLARDRLGEKPLYYGWQGNTLFFASELKALKPHPEFLGNIDRGALALLMQHNYIPAPLSIYENIHKLIPGTYLTLSLEQRNAKPLHYWDPLQVIHQSVADPFKGTPQDAVIELENILKRAIAQQMIADVPLGAFLSGGIDSTTVVALMQGQSRQPVKTFTIGFNEEGYNEAEHAKAVARHLGTDHTELYVTPEQAREVIPKLPTIYCEPFADSSQIPTYLVSQLARTQVTVSLSGDGGDELLGGYGRYFKATKLHHKVSQMPALLRSILPPVMHTLSAKSWNSLLHPLSLISGKRLSDGDLGNKIHLAADLLEHGNRSPMDLYRYLLSQWKNPAELLIGSVKEPSTAFSDRSLQPPLDGQFHQMMALDLITYLPDDILTKVDRAAMAVSLETRVPLLDHRVVEYAWSIPLAYKIQNNVGKWPLREVLYKYVPKEIMDRPKMGFGVPIGEWLRGSLRPWAEELLNATKLKQEGYFNPDLIKNVWSEHVSGVNDWEYQLWNVLMFQAWLAEQ